MSAVSTYELVGIFFFCVFKRVVVCGVILPVAGRVLQVVVRVRLFNIAKASVHTKIGRFDQVVGKSGGRKLQVLLY